MLRTGKEKDNSLLPKNQHREKGKRIKIQRKTPYGRGEKDHIRQRGREKDGSQWEGPRNRGWRKNRAVLQRKGYSLSKVRPIKPEPNQRKGVQKKGCRKEVNLFGGGA